MDALKIYIHLPKEKKTGEVWFIETMIAASETVGLNNYNRTALVLTVYWA